MLHPLDYAALAIYLLIVIAIAVRVSRASPDADDLFLAGRSLGWGVIGLPLFASNISSTTLIGLPGAAWQSGIAVANYEWMAALVLLFSAYFVVPRLLKARVTTVPQWLEQRFDARMQRYLSIVTVLLSLFLDTAGSLYAGSLVMMQFFPQLSLAPTCALIAVFAGLYTASGGLRAVVYTDVMQTLVLLLGSLLLSVIIFSEFDYSWAQVRQQMPDGHMSLIRPLNDKDLPWLGTLLGLPVLGFYYWTMNQYVSQRLLAARDNRAASYGALLAASLKLLPLFLMVFPGAMAAILLTDIDRADEVFPRMIVAFAPAGIAGLILAGLLAAIMSSIDSALNSCSTLITVDFIQPKRAMTSRQLATTGRWIIVVLVVVASIWAPMIDHFPGLFSYLQAGFSYVASPLVGVFLLGLWCPRVDAKAAFFATISGHLLSAILFALALQGIWTLHFTISAGILAAFTAGLAYVMALSNSETGLKAKNPAVAVERPDRYWKLLAGLVVSVTIVIVWVWR